MATSSNFFNSISNTKDDDFTAGEIDKDYSPFVVNKMLAQYSELIHYVNEMNISGTLEKRLQYEFYMGVVPKKKRRVLWNNKKKNPDINIVMEYYKISENKAEEYIRLLSHEQIECMENSMATGGKIK